MSFRFSESRKEEIRKKYFREGDYTGCYDGVYDAAASDINRIPWAGGRSNRLLAPGWRRTGYWTRAGRAQWSAVDQAMMPKNFVAARIY